jgi:hypothetical protein
LSFSIYSIRGKNIAIPKPSKTAAKIDIAMSGKILDPVRPNLLKFLRRINILSNYIAGILF